MTPASNSTKRPPAFQHFPPNRAKKLKKAWVQKAKIKSKWKAEKRKAGLLPPAQLTQVADDLSSGQEEVKVPDETSSVVTLSSLEKQKQPEAPPPKRPLHTDIAGQSARQLAKQVYSPSSLHTRRSSHGRSGRDDGRLNSVGRKGQPDMKLRMNALLAKIKQDYV